MNYVHDKIDKTRKGMNILCDVPKGSYTYIEMSDRHAGACLNNT